MNIALKQSPVEIREIIRTGGPMLLVDPYDPGTFTVQTKAVHKKTKKSTAKKKSLTQSKQTK